MRLLRLWFGLGEPVSRTAYAASGFALAAVKYAVDAAIVYGVTGRFWDPLTYLNPMFSVRMAAIQSHPTRPLLFFLALWALPFLWIGFSMTLRRAVDAGLSPWIALLFFIPVVNILVMLALCRRASQPGAVDPGISWSGPAEPEKLSETAVRTVLAALAGAACGVALVVLWVYGVRVYGIGLFVAGPFLMSLVAAYLYNRDRRRPFLETCVVVLLALALVAGALLIFALEGAVCIAMASPIALVEGLLGALVGAALATGMRRASGIAGAFVALPLILATDLAAPPPPLRRVVTTIEVAAPPEVVWEHVIGFSELPPPTELVFRLGIAYPTRARLIGSGVGAERHCEFSTGAFVEPITHWEPPRRLAFDVLRQPAPLEEWSPYRQVAAPHLLDATLRSRRGEFLLEPLPGGGARLQGTTWYDVDMAPGFYWGLWSDALIHRIHERVLRHVKGLAEKEGGHPR